MMTGPMGTMTPSATMTVYTVAAAIQRAAAAAGESIRLRIWDVSEDDRSGFIAIGADVELSVHDGVGNVSVWQDGEMLLVATGVAEWSLAVAALDAHGIADRMEAN